jgi:hypothetical protein
MKVVKLTHTEVKRMGRTVLARAGYDSFGIGTILPHWVDGFKRGMRFTKTIGRTKK